MCLGLYFNIFLDLVIYETILFCSFFILSKFILIWFLVINDLVNKAIQSNINVLTHIRCLTFDYYRTYFVVVSLGRFRALVWSTIEYPWTNPFIENLFNCLAWQIQSPGLEYNWIPMDKSFYRELILLFSLADSEPLSGVQLNTHGQILL